jgi:hypothetical protein
MILKAVVINDEGNDNPKKNLSLKKKLSEQIFK